MSTVAIEARLAHLEGTVGQIGDRLNGFDARFSNLERKLEVGLEALQGRMDQRFAVFDQRFADMDRRFTWLTGLVCVSILAPIAQHFLFR